MPHSIGYFPQLKAISSIRMCVRGTLGYSCDWWWWQFDDAYPYSDIISTVFLQLSVRATAATDMNIYAIKSFGKTHRWEMKDASSCLWPLLISLKTRTTDLSFKAHQRRIVPTILQKRRLLQYGLSNGKKVYNNPQKTGPISKKFTDGRKYTILERYHKVLIFNVLIFSGDISGSKSIAILPFLSSRNG
mgnify:FL=1